MAQQLYQIQEPEHKKQVHKAAIGIDLGTTNSVVAFVKENKIKLLADKDHNTLFPSTVDIVKRNGTELTLRSVKRLMGKTFEQAKASPLHRNLDIINENNRAKIATIRKNYTPEEISSMILSRLKVAFRESELKELEQAVITVPAFFSDNERQATQIAAELAGIKALRLINEPTAALLAYGLESEKKGNYVVYDLGGGTFDVSVLKLVEGVFQVKSTLGNVELGGDDFDLLIAEHFGFKEDNDFLQTAQSLKHKLTLQDIAIAEYKEQKYQLSAKDFYKLAKPLLDKTVEMIKQAIVDSKLYNIDGIVLVGGSTKMPIVKQALADSFNYHIFDDLNPDTIVAKGAAIQADKLLNKTSDILLVDVCPISLGIETMGGIFERIIERNSPIPTAKGQNFTTFKDNQSSLAINVYQGERELVKDCHLLGKLVLNGIPAMPAGMARIKISFIVDENSMLQVKAVEEQTGIEQSAILKSSISAEDSLAILKDSIMNARNDVHEKELIKSRVEIEQVIQASRNLINSQGLPKQEQADMIEYVDAIEEQIKDSKDKELLDNKRFELEEYFKDIVKANMNDLLSENLVGKALDDV
jgi:molecular chaperone HscA